MVLEEVTEWIPLGNWIIFLWFIIPRQILVLAKEVIIELLVGSFDILNKMYWT